MGCVETINPTAGKFPKQSEWLGMRTDVCFHYDSSRTVSGTIVRDDREAPFVTLIQLDDGPIVLATECQHSVPRHMSADRRAGDGLIKELRESVLAEMRDGWGLAPDDDANFDAWHDKNFNANVALLDDLCRALAVRSSAPFCRLPLLRRADDRRKDGTSDD